MAEALELEAVEGDDAGGVVLVFDDKAIKRRCRIGPAAVQILLGQVALAQAKNDHFMAFPVELFAFRQASAADQPPVLTIWPKLWPRLDLSLTWKQVEDLAKSAKVALKAATPSGRPN